MSGTFSKTNRPLRPGGYFNFNAIPSNPPSPGLAGIVAVPFVNDWGPAGVPTLLQSMNDYQAAFGDSQNTVGFRDVFEAFEGEGLDGFGGAGAVLAYRICGSAAAKASHAFTNTTPVTALTLTALYNGTRANTLNVTTQAAAGLTNIDQLLIFDGQTLVESYNYSHVTTDVNALATAINAVSKWVVATVQQSGVPLTYVANAALSGGLGGESTVSGDWTTMLSVIETQLFSIIAGEWPTDTPTLNALKAWVDAKRAVGKMIRAVVGGASAESSATALARAAILSDEGFINLGQGTFTDSTFGVLGTTQLAPRVAGALAARGESKALTYARFTNLVLTAGATDTEILSAFTGGLTVFARDSNTDAPVRIEKGLTGFVATNNVAKPLAIYREPKFIATMDAIQTELTTFAEQNVIGKLTVSASTRAYVRNQVEKSLKAREDQGIIQPGWSVLDDYNPPATPQDTFMQFQIAITFGRSVEQVYFTCSVA